MNRADACSDLYSLGCSFFFLLTGRPPFLAETIPAVLSKHRNEPPPSLRELVPDAPLELDKVYLRMVAKRPEDRFSTAKEISDELGDWERKADATAQNPLSSNHAGAASQSDCVGRQN